MKIEIRLYKQHDADLIALAANGYQISAMMRASIIGYANGSPVHFLLNKPLDADFNILKTFRTRFNIPVNEERALYLLQGIKRGYRNAFCKAILRNSLIQQDLAPFFSRECFDILSQMHIFAGQFINTNGFSNVIPADSFIQGAVQKVYSAPEIRYPQVKPVPVPAPIPTPVVQSFQTFTGFPSQNMQAQVMPPVIQTFQQPEPVAIEETDIVHEQHTEMPVQDISVPSYDTDNKIYVKSSNQTVENLEKDEDCAILNIDTDSHAMSILDSLMGNDWE